MPVQKGTSKLLAKYGAKLDSAVKAHAHDPIKVGGSRVPAGITNGIAKLTEIVYGEVEAGKQNAGEIYFRANAVCVEPEFITGPNGDKITTRGCFTGQFEMLCETKTNAGKVTTQEEHVANVMNHLKLLGGSPDDLERGGAALEEVAAALVEHGPHFRFSTSVRASREYFDPKTKQKVKGEEGVWENWYGIKDLADYVPPDGTVAGPGTFTDNTGDAQTQTAGENQPPDDAPPTDTAADPDPDGANEEAMVNDLVARSMADDTAAQAQLSEAAIARGWPKKTVDDAQSWEDAGVMAKTDPPSTAGSNGQGKEPWKPDVAGKGVCKYLPHGADGKPLLHKTTKKPLGSVKVEVLGVEKNGTYKVRNLDDGKTMYAAKLEHLQPS